MSPLSSMVTGLLLRYPGFSLEEAESAVRAKLAVGASVDLFADYVADGASNSGTAADSGKLERVARVLSVSFGIDFDQIGAHADVTAEPLAAFSLVTQNAELQLAGVASAVAAEQSENRLVTIAAALKRIDGASLEARLDRSRKPHGATSSMRSRAGSTCHSPGRTAP